MSRLLTTVMLAALTAAPASARMTAKVTVDGVEYSVTVMDRGEAVATRTGLRLWADRVGDWRRAMTAIEQVSGCRAAHVNVDHASGGVPVGLWALLDCSNTTVENSVND